MAYISVAIPTYEMKDLGATYLKHSFDILCKQTFRDFDIVISDHSQTDAIMHLCEEYKEKLEIHYLRNKNNIGSSSANINNAIKNAKGKLIKILFQDDFLYDEKSLENIVNNFDITKDYWLVTACEHTRDGVYLEREFYPHYNDQIHLGVNTISSPSVLTIKNEQPLFFDEKLIWLMDCDYYKRYYMVHGAPKIVNQICTVNRIGKHQITNTLANQQIRELEYQYAENKFEQKKLKLPKVTLVTVSSVHLKETVQALKYSMKDIEYAEAILISHEKPEDLPLDITFVKCDKISSLDAYSKFMLFDLAKHIHTDFALIVQHDGYVVRPDRWSDDFLNYDYIGAPWPHGSHFTKDGTPVLVGNGGFSLRSKRMLNIFNELNLPFSDGETGYFNEDGVICNYFRKELEQANIVFAPTEIAQRFSLEDKSFKRNIKPFGFHRNKKFVPFFFYVKNLNI